MPLSCTIPTASPLDLTELILKENGLKVDIEVFNRRMQEQKERARNAAAVETGDWVVLREGEQQFVGYDSLTCDTEILRYRKIRQEKQGLLPAGAFGYAVLCRDGWSGR